jgi:hypothetical protein
MTGPPCWRIIPINAKHSYRQEATMPDNERVEELRSVAGKDLATITRQHAAKRLSGLESEDVLKALKAQGIDDLHSLVREVLKDVRAGAHLGGGNVANDTFIYDMFIYRTSMPAADLEQAILEARGGG